MKYCNKLNKPDWSVKLSRSFIGKLETESGTEITERYGNLLFKLSGHFFGRKAGPLLLIYGNPAIRSSPDKKSGAVPRQA